MSLRLPGHRNDFGERRHSDRGPRRGFQKQTFPDLVITNASKVDVAKTEHYSCDDFDEILELVGSEGKLQKQLLYGFLLPFVAMLPFFILSLIFMLYEPNHWCHVPGKNPDISEEAWKNLTIPREPSAAAGGVEEYSKCSMIVPNGNGSKSECTHGWDYDRSDYKETIPSYLNWVCTRGHYVTTVYTVAAIGSCVGTPLYGWTGDKIGRKLVFFIVCLVNILFRGISYFVPQYFEVFLVTQFLVGSTFPMIYIMPFTILAEICSNNYRSWIYASTWMIWVIGICLLPFVAWLCADWFLIGIVTWVPGVFIFLYYKFVPESPRWLVSAGRMDDALVVIKNMARVNGTESNFKQGQLEGMLKSMHDKQMKSEEKAPHAWDLFKHRRLAVYTSLIAIVWAMNGLVYYGITLNSTSMAGNQFLNFFYLSLIELPAGWLGRVLVEKAGRRWSQVLFFTTCAIGFAMAAIGVINNNSVLVILSVVVSKFSVSFTSLVVNLQANEIFPTQLRSTGNGVVGTFGAFIQIVAPTIIYLRNFHEGAPYMAMGVISLIGVISSAFIPETLNQSLPETIEDSNNLGKNTKFWSFLPIDYKTSNNDIAYSNNKGFISDENTEVKENGLMKP